jgi:hypothetical protein
MLLAFQFGAVRAAIILRQRFPAFATGRVCIGLYGRARVADHRNKIWDYCRFQFLALNSTIHSNFLHWTLFLESIGRRVQQVMIILCAATKRLGSLSLEIVKGAPGVPALTETSVPAP